MKYANLKLHKPEAFGVRERLLMDVVELIQNSKLSQQEVGKKLSISQPKVCNLMKEKIEFFSMETLLNYLCILGCEIQIKIKKPKSKCAIFRRKGQISIS